jgi:hypothetical protein
MSLRNETSGDRMDVLRYCVVDIARFQQGVWAVERGSFRPGDALACLERAKVDVDPTTDSGAVNPEVDRLRAGISWVRGMCTDGEPLEVIDAKLGEILNG